MALELKQERNLIAFKACPRCIGGDLAPNWERKWQCIQCGHVVEKKQANTASLRDGYHHTGGRNETESTNTGSNPGT